MAKEVPRIVEQLCLVLQDTDGPILAKGSEERAAAGSTIQPDDKWNVIGGLVEVAAHCTKELIMHAAGSSWAIPVDLLEACMLSGVPE